MDKSSQVTAERLASRTSDTPPLRLPPPRLDTLTNTHKSPSSGRDVTSLCSAATSPSTAHHTFIFTFRHPPHLAVNHHHVLEKPPPHTPHNHQPANIMVADDQDKQRVAAWCLGGEKVIVQMKRELRKQMARQPFNDKPFLGQPLKADKHRVVRKRIWAAVETTDAGQTFKNKIPKDMHSKILDWMMGMVNKTAPVARSRLWPPAIDPKTSDPTAQQSLDMQQMLPDSNEIKEEQNEIGMISDRPSISDDCPSEISRGPSPAAPCMRGDQRIEMTELRGQEEVLESRKSKRKYEESPHRTSASPSGQYDTPRRPAAPRNAERLDSSVPRAPKKSRNMFGTLPSPEPQNERQQPLEEKDESPDMVPSYYYEPPPPREQLLVLGDHVAKNWGPNTIGDLARLEDYIVQVLKKEEPPASVKGAHESSSPACHQLFTTFRKIAAEWRKDSRRYPLGERDAVLQKHVQEAAAHLLVVHEGLMSDGLKALESVLSKMGEKRDKE
ncbi:hypothetical protein M409DRAFT_29491 [Zasmidium cellare ATCC 36951]|uniref:Uncharacterized protein n=1 Tax=Zasmidium cellare ATCC 36951 TaxID=1080233 RepID=A0A6A6C2S7_ZASCE|nr:uncharacterized protein M409DRAFT_29491 [Zasmidium cellare ATCC 36951]KAF2160039.1 hypothetical protein M409DRAFT_29491 [Zasmidium cellare ATCC 36951]